jgi:hypothetical protein
MPDSDTVTEPGRLMTLLSYPLRLRIIRMVLNRDPGVFEFFHVIAEPQNRIFYPLRKLKSHGLTGSYYCPNHHIFRINEKRFPALTTMRCA